MESVKRIIEDGKIDVNFASSISYGDSEDLNIEQATPLFVAASMGHVEIVRYLVEIAGADIFAKVSGVLIHLSTDSLWEWGLDGVTSLYAFLFPDKKEEESLAIVQILLDGGADPNVKNDMGFTPMVAAAYYGGLAVLNFLLERDEISQIEKIDALELAGAVIIREGGSGLMDKAFEYWRKSLKLRLTDTGGGGPITKTQNTILKIGWIKEWATSEELEHVINNHSEYLTQSLLVGLRILPARSWNALKWFIKPLSSITHPEHMTSHYAYTTQQKLNIFWLILETFRGFDVRVDEDLWRTTIEVVIGLIQTLLELRRNNVYPFMNGETTRTSLELILMTDQLLLHKLESLDCECYVNTEYINSMFDLVKMLADLPQMMNEENMEFLSELIRRDQRRTSFVDPHQVRLM